jgi:transcriptional regulator with XRE-family HTH domain
VQTQLGDYLRTRRALLVATDVGLPDDGSRRVPGLRRSEVAKLAGISTEYYLRLEQGRERQPSDQVLTALARALRLDDDGQDYLVRLARRAARPSSGGEAPRPPAQVVDPTVLRLLDGWERTPAAVLDRNLDVLAANPLVRALVPIMFEPRVNLLMSVFDGASRAGELTGLWLEQASRLAAALRFHGEPGDPRYDEIVASLRANDPMFAEIWARHEVRTLVSGPIRVDAPGTGWIDLSWQILQIPKSPGCFILSFVCDRGSMADAALQRLSDGLAADPVADSRPYPVWRHRAGPAEG